MGTVRLQAGRVKPVWLGHPWVYAQAIAEVVGAPGPGDVVTVVDPGGKFLGRGFYSPKSAIPVRIMSRNEDERLDEPTLGRRIERALEFRKSLGFPSGATNGFRLLHAEGDAFPGLIVDVFGDTAVIQFTTAGTKRREASIIAHVARVTGAKSVVEAASSMKKTEGFESEWSVVRGKDINTLEFKERGFEFSVPSTLDQKTGYYFDQRDTRARVEAIAKDLRVLDAFAYLGGFGLAASRGGAREVLSVDSSAAAFAAASAIAHHNGEQITFRRDDVKKLLPNLAQRGEKFEMVIIDPPKLVPTRRHRDKGMRAYARLNQNAAKLVAPDGILVSCSCSGALSSDDLLRVVAEAAARSGRVASVFHVGGAAADHPAPAAFREGRYLKTVFARLSG